MPKKTLKVLRVEKDLTQAQVAKKLNIDPATWSKWERGERFPNVIYIKKIEKIFNIRFEDILFLNSSTV